MVGFILAAVGSVAQVAIWQAFRGRIDAISTSNRWNLPTAALFFVLCNVASRISGYVYERRNHERRAKRSEVRRGYERGVKRRSGAK